MYNYNQTLKYTSLNEAVINHLNTMLEQNPHQTILVEIPNTKGVSSNLLRQLNPRVSLRIAGAYDDKRIQRYGKTKYKNGETGEYYTTAVIYKKSEAIKIVEEMERIEKGLDKQNFSQLEKVVYIYENLKSGIMYDPKFEEKQSREVRSLRGLITKQTVCAGYAVILKEMLDRQGIECHYVSGKARNGGGHAWNIVTIDGKNYPIDLTWENGKFRGGKSKTFDFLGQNIEKFKENHIPYKGEPCENYVLSGLDPKIIKQIRDRIVREKGYQSTTYYGTRKNGSKYMIAQVGDKEENDKKYYRYYYADVLSNGKLANQTILYSNTNVAHFINEKQWDKFVPQGYEEALDNILFSKENINDSLSKGTQYIGQVTRIRNDGKRVLVTSASEIEKPVKEQQKFKFSTKEFKRTDGTTFVVQQMGKRAVIEGIPINTYHIFEVVEENNRKFLKRNIVYSERDFWADNRPGIANEYLSRERLDRKVAEAGGYIGYYDKNGTRVYNPKLVEYFKKTIENKVEPNNGDHGIKLSSVRDSEIKVGVTKHGIDNVASCMRKTVTGKANSKPYVNDFKS